MTAEIIQDDVLHALQDFDYIGVESSPFYVASSRKRLRDELEKARFLEPKKEESKKEETPLFPSLNNDDETL